MSPQKTPLFSSPLVRISGSLEACTSIGQEVDDVAELGLRSRYKEDVWKAVTRWYRTGTQPFVSVCIRYKGERVVHRSVGHSHGAWALNGMARDAVPGTVETPVGVFSASKALTALLIHGLAEDGLLDLERRVAYYLPEFNNNGKQAITVSQVLSHQAGMPTMPKHLGPETLFDYDQVVDAIMKSPVQRPVGRGTAYHAVSGGYVLGALANKVTGHSLNQILRRRLAVPLGLSTLRYGATLDNQPKVALNYNTGRPLRWPINKMVETTLGADWNSVIDLSNRPEFLSTIVPAGNACGSADEWSVLMQLLLNQGRVGQTEVFKPATIDRLLSFRAGSLIDGTLRVPSRFSEGLMLGTNPVSLFGPMTGQAAGHLGLINVFCWADPSRDLSVALLSTGKSLFGLHLAELGRTLWAINRVSRR